MKRGELGKRIKKVKAQEREHQHEIIERIKARKLYKNVQVHFCPKCQKDQKFYQHRTRLRAWGCYKCRYQYSPTAGTIFEKSTLSTRRWNIAIEMCQEDKFVKATDIQKAIGGQYKTAWRIRKLILRELYPEYKSKGKGYFDIDETREFKGNQYVKIRN